MNLPENKLIAIDIDEVLADNIVDIAKWHNKNYNISLNKKDFLTYRFWETWGGTREQAVKKYHNFMRERGEFISPVPGSEEGIKQLSRKNTLIAVTSRPLELQDLTIKWINKNFGKNIKEIHFGNSYSKNTDKETKKSEILRKLGIKLLIDDQIRHAEDCANAGAKVLLIDAPWNQGFENSEMIKRVFSWREVVRLLTD